MGPKKIDHIGVAVKDLEAAKSFYEGALGLKVDHEETFGDMKIAFIPVGEVNIELIEPMTEDGVIGKFIAKRGEGIHHIAYEVDDVVAVLEGMKSQGLKLVDEAPRKGAHGSEVAFLHPKSSLGVLTEVVKRKE
jgi:methylmalonyl-CoA epimerase